MFETVSHDVRYAWRSLRRTPAFTIFAVLILSAAIGATTALFSVLDQVIVRPLGYMDPDRLVVVHEILPTSATPRSPVNAAHFEEWRAAARSFEQMALLFPVSFALSDTAEPEQNCGARASASLFTMLGAPILHGRTFSEDEDTLGRDRVVVLGHDLWIRRFGADAAIVGRQIRLDGEPHTVVGVLTPGFELSSVSRLYPMTVVADGPQLWTPLGLRPFERTPGQAFNFACIARLKPQVSDGVSLESSPRPSVYLPYWHAFVSQAAVTLRTTGEPNAIVPALRAAIRQLDPEMAVPGLESIEQIVSRSVRTRRCQMNLALLFAMTALVLTSLGLYSTLIHTTKRRTHEIAIRIALGAKPADIRRLVLVQALTPVTTGIGAGFVAALGIAPLLRGLLFGISPTDPRVFALTAIVLGTVSIVAGYLPGLRAWQVNPLAAMRSE